MQPVVVITGFDTHLNMPITARGGAAVVQTGVGLIGVGIVAVFLAYKDVPVPTGGLDAVVEASILLAFVAVITGFVPGFARSDSLALVSIATTG